jgi:biopolymer transport protein ExbD
MSTADAISDDDEKGYETLEEVTKAIKKAGVNSCGLIFGKL